MEETPAVSEDELWNAIESYLVAEDLELDDLELAGQGPGRLLRVVIDAAGGIDLDRLSDASQGLSRLIDELDGIDGPYTLEVTSPGLERPLRRPDHFHKSVGRELDVKTRQELEGTVRHRGVLEDADDEGFVVVTGGERRRIPYADVAWARTVFRWERAPKPGKKPARKVKR